MPVVNVTNVAVIVLGVVCALSVVGTWLAKRRGLRTVTEVFAGIAILLALLTIAAFAITGTHRAALLEWAGIGAATGSVAIALCAYWVRVRSWLWSGLVGGVLSLGLLFDSVGTRWWATAGHVAIAFVALGANVALSKLGQRFGSRLRTEHVTMLVLQVASSVVAIAQIVQLDAPSTTVHLVWAIEFLVCIALATMGLWFWLRRPTN